MSALTCCPAETVHYWCLVNYGYEGNVFPNTDTSFQPECLAEALPEMRRLIADDYLRARHAFMDTATERDLSELKRLDALWRAAEAAS